MKNLIGLLVVIFVLVFQTFTTCYLGPKMDASGVIRERIKRPFPHSFNGMEVGDDVSCVASENAELFFLLDFHGRDTAVSVDCVTFNRHRVGDTFAF